MIEPTRIDTFVFVQSCPLSRSDFVCRLDACLLSPVVLVWTTAVALITKADITEKFKRLGP